MTNEQLRTSKQGIRLPQRSFVFAFCENGRRIR